MYNRATGFAGEKTPGERLGGGLVSARDVPRLNCAVRDWSRGRAVAGKMLGERLCLVSGFEPHSAPPIRQNGRELPIWPLPVRGAPRAGGERGIRLTRLVLSNGCVSNFAIKNGC